MDDDKITELHQHSVKVKQPKEQLQLQIDPDKIPATLRDAIKLYDAMYAESQPYTGADATDENTRIYHGKVTELFAKLGISTTYYTPIRRFLIGTGSIEMAKRGSRGLASDVLLHHPPPLETPQGDAIVKITPEGLTETRHLATLCAELERRIARLDAWRETMGGVNIAEVLRNHESRIAKLESKD